jgi:ribulose-5-phosphate 4-epimerase/fuculose-1-phosphate aldolase
MSSSARDQAIVEVAQAGRVLYAQGVLDAFGHVTRRSPDDPGRFLMTRNMAPGLATPADVIELNLDGDVVSPAGARPFLERFIHGEIYRSRPDVQAIVHSHSQMVVPYTVVPSVRLRPICHMCGFLHGLGETFEVASTAGPDSNLLITSAKMGADLARHLADQNLVLMRGHGFTVVAETLPQVVFRAVYTQTNARLQTTALALGPPIYLTAGEAATADATMNTQVDRAWNLWVHELGD